MYRSRGVDAAALTEAMAQGDVNNLFGFFNLFVGGAFLQAGLFALGIMPYITASIIIQLLGAAVPYFQKLQREGEEGRRKITQLTRYGTAGITALQSIGYSLYLLNTVRSAIVIGETQFIITTVIVPDGGYHVRDVAGRAHYGERYWERHQPHHYHWHHRLPAPGRHERVSAGPEQVLVHL